MAFPWRCPFCGHYATIGEQNSTSNSRQFGNGNKYGAQTVYWVAITCPNPSCREYTFRVEIMDCKLVEGVMKPALRRYDWNLVPAAEIQVFPDYVPPAILADYREACLIANLSPKASATLARRCLQGMIRDFWGVKPGRLVDEIKAIEAKVDSDAWNAIEAVRSVGNIGAHMGTDINVIVDVEPDEAKLLIGLIETLVAEWYVARHERKSRFGKLTDLAKNKLLARKGGP